MFVPAALFFSVLSLSVVSCSKKESPVDVGNKQQILHHGNGAEPKDLDPHIITGVPEHSLMAALFEGLISEDPKTLAPEPGVAESWTVSKDGLNYTFNLRKNAKWHNGDSVTAHDFVYGWNRILSPKLGAEYAYMLFMVKNAEAFHKGQIKDFSKVGVKAEGDFTLKVSLEHSTPYFLSLLQHYSTFPVNKKVVEKFGAMDENGTKWTRVGNFVGNGPFTLEEWSLNKVIRVAKFKDYWDAKVVRLNEIHFYPIESSETEERAFRAGQLHVTNVVPNEKIEVWRKNNPENLRIDPYLGTYYYRFNVTRKPMDDVRVRKALTLAIDRDAITKYVTKAGEIPAFSFTPPNTGGYTPQAKVSFDIALAKKLLAEAGYPEGKGWPGAEILYNTLEAHQKIAVAIQEMWKKNLGIDVTLTNQDWKVYLASQKGLDYYMSRAGWIGDYADPNTFLDMFVSDGGNNQTGWSNKKYDALIAKAARTPNQQARFEVFQEAEAILLEELPVLPIYTYTSKRLVTESVQGWFPNILDHHPFKYVFLGNDEGQVVSQK